MVAAYSPEGAIAVLCEQTGNGPDDYELNEVVLVSDKSLDSTLAIDHGEGIVVTMELTLRQEIALLCKHTYMYGWE